MSLVNFTVTRNTQKNVINSEGFLENVGNNVPGFEYKRELIVVFDDPESDSDEIEEVFTYRGALIEPASTNYAKESEDLDNATYWTPLRTTIATNTETDPKGGTNSFLLSETVDNGVHYIITEIAERPSISLGETWTQSIFVKKGDGANAPDIIQLTHSGSEFGATNYANYDISVGGGTSGTVTASNGGTAGIRYYGNGWYRISWTSTSTGAGSGALLVIFTNDNPTASRAPSYAGQTDANVFIWGAQLEQASEPSSYIKTEGSIATRNADIIRLLNADQYTPNKGQVVLEWEQYESDTLHIGLVSGSVEPGVRKLKFIYTSTEQKLYIDDVLVDSITGNYDWSGMDKIELGNFNGSDQPTTHLRLFAINENTV
jgi:hypothetical protein